MLTKLPPRGFSSHCGFVPWVLACLLPYHCLSRVRLDSRHRSRRSRNYPLGGRRRPSFLRKPWRRSNLREPCPCLHSAPERTAGGPPGNRRQPRQANRINLGVCSECVPAFRRSSNPICGNSGWKRQPLVAGSFRLGCRPRRASRLQVACKLANGDRRWCCVQCSCHGDRAGVGFVARRYCMGSGRVPNRRDGQALSRSAEFDSGNVGLRSLKILNSHPTSLRSSSISSAKASSIAG